jgi:hypothetical protein
MLGRRMNTGLRIGTYVVTYVVTYIVTSLEKMSLSESRINVTIMPSELAWH